MLNQFIILHKQFNLTISIQKKYILFGGILFNFNEIGLDQGRP